MLAGDSLIKMVDIQNRGRALVSTKPLRAGEVVLRDSPILLYSAFSHGAVASALNYCSHCFRTIAPHSATTVFCPNCSTSSPFCSPQCQSLALSTSHTPFVCQALRRLRAADSPLLQRHHETHLQAWFLVAAYNIAMTSPSHFQTLLSLQGEAFVDDASVFLHSVITSVCQLPNAAGNLGFSVELTAALLAKDKLNAFGLMEPFAQDKERSVRAYGIYPIASFFNHDCLPNACRFDYVDSVTDLSNTDIVVRVLHDVDAGREICLSYFPVNYKYSERQQRLKEDYGFICDCDRCKVEANWSDGEEEEEMEHEEEDDMDEDENENGGDDEEIRDKENDDFPHAYFFMRYMCSRENCGGTLAPLPSSSMVMECNVCGSFNQCDD